MIPILSLGYARNGACVELQACVPGLSPLVSSSMRRLAVTLADRSLLVAVLVSTTFFGVLCANHGATQDLRYLEAFMWWAFLPRDSPIQCSTVIFVGLVRVSQGHTVVCGGYAVFACFHLGSSPRDALCSPELFADVPCALRRVLNFCICLVCHFVWRRCDPEYPWKRWLAAFLVTAAVVPTLRVVLYQKLTVPYVMASAAYTTDEFKHVSMAFHVCAFVLNVMLPYAMHTGSAALTQNQKHFFVFGMLIIGYGMCCVYQDYYVRDGSGCYRGRRPAAPLFVIVCLTGCTRSTTA